MSDSEIRVINQTERVLKVRVDYSRVLLIRDRAVTFNVTLPTVGFGFSTSQNVEYNVVHNVDTFTAFTTIEVNGKSTFRPQNNDEYHAYMTVLSKNDDGSWYMRAENHPITKRCHVVIDRNIYVRQKYKNYIQSSKGFMLKNALQMALLRPTALCMGLRNPILYPPVAAFYCAKIMLSEDNMFATNDYRFGRIVVLNESSKNIWVKAEADEIDVRRVITRNSAHVNVADPIPDFNITSVGMEGSVNSTVERNVYYRANQGTGFTLIGRKSDSESCTTVFYLKSSDNHYFLSISYEKEDGVLEQYYNNHPDQLSDASVLDGAFIPCITISDHDDGINVELERRDISFRPVEIIREAIRCRNSSSSSTSSTSATSSNI